MRHLRFPSKQLRHSGYTLVEVTLVLSVLLMMATVLFLGAHAYRKGSDRALCIQNIATVQKAVRAYGNLNELVPGTTVPNLKNEIVGSEKFLPSPPRCPAGGLYTFRGNTLPAVGELYLSCSEEGHLPREFAAW